MSNTNRYVTRNNDFDENQDFYPTPAICTIDLLKREEFDINILEPACGDGSMSSVLKDHGYEVVSSDLIDRGYGRSGIDFLEHYNKLNGDVITNPPYKIAKEFLLKALKISKRKVAFFMRLSFLESKERYEIFKQFPPYKVYVLSYRPKIYKNGDHSNNSGMVAYCWIVWDKEYKGPTLLDWII